MLQNTNILRATGLLVIEVINSNPNGDPDRESDPRVRPDGKGEISPVSFKRKLRDLVQNDLDSVERGPVWDEISKKLNLNKEDFCILENRGRNRTEITKEVEDKSFCKKYWDARVFGNTFLEEGGDSYIKTGVVQFGLGVSINPVRIRRHTNTNKSGVEAGKDRGMAPLAYRVVEHGIYCMPFFVNPTAATKTGCTQRDIDLLLELIPYAYPHTRSYIRSCVDVRNAYYVTHKSAIGSLSDFRFIESAAPKYKNEQYEFSCIKELEDEYKDKFQFLGDLTDGNFRDKMRK